MQILSSCEVNSNHGSYFERSFPILTETDIAYENPIHMIAITNVSLALRIWNC